MQVKATPIRIKHDTLIQDKPQLTTDVLVKHSADDVLESLLNGYTVMWDQTATTELKTLRSKITEALEKKRTIRNEAE